MKKINLILALLIALNSNAYTVTNVTNDTTLSGNWNLSGGILRISAKISGAFTISNALIEANPFIQIFDTLVSLSGCRTREFSVMWYGAKTSVSDNYNAIQKSFNTCVVNAIKFVYIPGGNYQYGSPLKVYNFTGTNYIAEDLNIYGDGGFVSDATTLTYTSTNGYAFGFQFAKGGSIHDLKIIGKFAPPAYVPGNTIPYYALTEAEFVDTNHLCAVGYSGIIVDYDATHNIGGSTGLEIYNVWLTNFDVCYNISPLGNQNGDVLTFRNVRCGNTRVGVQSNSAQNKGDLVSNLMCWDNTYTVFKSGTSGLFEAGNWTVDRANIAGGVIQFMDVDQVGRFSTHFTNLYAENLGRIGKIHTGDGLNKNPVTVDNSQFDLALQGIAGVQTVLNINSSYICLNNSQLRYYGAPTDTLHFFQTNLGNFINCGIANPTTGLISNQILLYPIQLGSGYGRSSLKITLNNQ